jgi:anti-sigma regulatory factor (Ser/Thr protein kinase)
MPGLTDPAPEIRERLVLRSEGDDLEAVFPWFEAIAERLGLPARAAFRIHVVLEEAVTNAVVHGHEPGVAGEVALEINGTPERVIAVLRDTGRPFNPILEPPLPAAPIPIREAAVGGLGVKLMRTFCSNLNYQRADQTNELTMEFDVSAMAAAKPADGDT